MAADTSAFKYNGNPTGAPFAVTPSDTVDLARMAQYIMVNNVGGGTNVAYIGVDGKTGTIQGLIVGVQYRVNATRILVTGTTAASIVGIP